MRKLTTLVIVAIVLIGGAFAAKHFNLMGRLFGYGPNVTDVVSNTLISVQEMNRLTVFAATFSAIVTTQEDRPGPFDRRQTLIAPGTVRYDVDFKSISRRQLSWDGAAKILRINVPDLLISDPAMDPRRALKYADGVAWPLTETDKRLETKNWDAASNSVKAQAASVAFVSMARRSARVAIANNFELPLRAAGIDARVVVRFPGEAS